MLLFRTVWSIKNTLTNGTKRAPAEAFCIVEVFDSIPPEIRKGALMTLRRATDAKAVVLFGSRARDDSDAQSDWDIALITSRGDCVRELDDDSGFDNARQHGHEINCFALPEALVEGEACHLGTLQRGIVRDGVILAGTWNIDRLKGVELRMDMTTFLNHINVAHNRTRSAIDCYERIARGNQDYDIEETDCRDFIAYTADAAEHLAKAMLISLGIDPEKKHDLKALADQVRNAGHARQAGIIHSLNGFVRGDHIVPYEPREHSFARAQNASKRLAGVMTLYKEVVQSLPDSVPEESRARHVQRASAVFRDIQGRLTAIDLNASAPRRHLVDGLLSEHETLIGTAKSLLSEMPNHNTGTASST